MASSADDFIMAICSSLATSPLKDIYVEMASLSTDETFFGDNYNYALALRSAHLFMMDKTRPDGTAGLITNKTESRTSVSYWNDVKGNSDLHMTTYGKRLMSLIKTIGGRASVAATTDVFIP